MEVYLPKLESVKGRPVTSFFSSCSDPALIFVRIWEYLVSQKNTTPEVSKDLWHMKFAFEEDGQPMNVQVYINKVQQEKDPEISSDEQSDIPDILFVHFALSS
jgi:hypothetical protein